MSEHQTAPQLTDEEVIKSYLSDEKVTKNLAIWADFLMKRFHGNWFTKERILKKSSMKTMQEVDQLVALMILKGHMVQKKIGNEIKLKITLDLTERLKLMEDHLQQAQAQVKNIEAGIESLKAEIANSNKN